LFFSLPSVFIRHISTSILPTSQICILIYPFFVLLLSIARISFNLV
jgi:hypothetical protein